MKLHLKIALAMTSILAARLSNGQDSAFSVSAYVDMYYGYDFNRPNVTNGFTARNQRPYVTQYDQHNSFALNHAILFANYSRGKADAEVAIQTGTFAINNYAHEPSILYRMIHRARVGYQVFESGRIDAGIMGGHFGYESALVMEREMLSPALATEYTPYYQTGVQYSHELSASTSVRAVVLNGWQTIAENDDAKAVGMAIDQKIGEAVTISYGNFFGKQGDSFTQSQVWKRSHHNVVLSYRKDALGLVAIGDFTRQEWIQQDPTLKDGNVLFLTGIASLQVSDKVGIATRYEYVKDSRQILISTYQGLPLDLQVVSFCINYQPDEIISFKIEPKYYLGDQDYFKGHGEDYNRSMVICASLAVWMR